MESLKAILPRARVLLRVPSNRPDGDLWLWEHSQRVMRLTGLLGRVPELSDERPDPTAAALAGLFHDAGWAIQAREGQVSHWQVLNRPTNDIQRELAANLLASELDGALPREVLDLAVEAIRQCNIRDTKLPEAQVVAEAESLDEIGVLYVLRQFRQYQAEGRPLEAVLANWARQREYRFWEARINEGLRFELSRQIARTRLEAVESFMSSLARDVSAADVTRALADAGIPIS